MRRLDIAESLTSARREVGLSGPGLSSRAPPRYACQFFGIDIMIVRAMQMATMEEAAIQSFESRCLPVLAESFPRHFRMLGSDGLMSVIRAGIDLAKQDGHNAEGDVLTYIKLMLMLGSGFRFDAQIPWAWQILYGSPFSHGPSRIEFLYEVAHEYLLLVGGAENGNMIAATRRLRDDHQFFFQQDSPWVLLRALFWEKCEYLGPDGLQDLVRRGRRRAARHGMATKEGEAMCCALLLVLGDAFDSDPQYPELQRACAADLGDPTAKLALVSDAVRRQMGEFLS